MKEGYEVNHGGYLARDKWLGEFDFLVINHDIHSNFGDYGYEVIDTKNSKKPKSTHIILICPKCVASFITWLMHSTEKTSNKKPFRNSLSEDTKEDMR